MDYFKKNDPETVDRIAEGIREHLDEIKNTVFYAEILQALEIVAGNYRDFLEHTERATLQNRKRVRKEK